VGGDADLDFWRATAATTSGSVVELGCGAGRILTAIATADRVLVGLDLDAAALSLARERLPEAALIQADLLTWTPPETLRHGAGLVIAGGDLLPLLTEATDLERLFAQAAMLLRADGAFGIDATLIDAELLSEAASDSAWSEDVRWASDEFGEVRRESRLLPDPAGRAGCAQLQIRHWHAGDTSPDQRDPFAIRAWQPVELERIAEGVGLLIHQRGPADRLRWLLRSTHV
jgi:SAM-dependent methyltransferase